MSSDGSTCVKESVEHVEVRTQVCEEESSSVLVEHGGSISER